jgi:hypothetical protein
MDNTSTTTIYFAVFGALSAAQRILDAASSIIDDVPTSYEKRLNLKKKKGTDSLQMECGSQVRNSCECSSGIVEGLDEQLSWPNEEQ